MGNEFGEAVKWLRDAAGMSRASLAARATMSVSHLRNLENGHRRPTSDAARVLDDVLSAHGSIIELATATQPAHRTALLAQVGMFAISPISGVSWADSDPVPTQVVRGESAIAPLEADWRSDQRSTSSSDPAEVAAILHLREHFQEMYRRVGGGPTRPRITAVLHSKVAPLLRAKSHDQQLYQAVGGLTALAGVCAYDADKQPLAQRYLYSALAMARAAGDPQFGAYTIALIANQAMHLREYDLVVQSTDIASDGATPALATDLHALAAKASARLHDEAACHGHLKLTEQAAARIGSANELAEASYVTPGLVETQVAEALRRLGDLSAAHDYAVESVRTADATHLRGQVHRYAGLAMVLTGQGEYEQAAEAGAAMLDRAIGMESGRIRDRIGTVVAALNKQPQQPGVAEFLERANATATWEKNALDGAR